MNTTKNNDGIKRLKTKF